VYLYFIFGLYLKSICKYNQTHVTNSQQNIKHCLI